jgi:ferredoxin
MNLCQSNGECVIAAPDVFELGDDDLLVWQEDVSDERRDEVEDAVNRCPMAAISIEG